MHLFCLSLQCLLCFCSKDTEVLECLLVICLVYFICCVRVFCGKNNEGQTRAIKITSSKNFKDSEKNALQILQANPSPFVVQVYSIQLIDDLVIIEMEYADGGVSSLRIPIPNYIAYSFFSRYFYRHLQTLFVKHPFQRLILNIILSSFVCSFMVIILFIFIYRKSFKFLEYLSYILIKLFTGMLVPFYSGNPTV